MTGMTMTDSPRWPGMAESLPASVPTREMLESCTSTRR